ncbi:MAG: hypothetical protein LBH82_05240 [Bacteroidales bacterium]|jgi:hypothetical protein|nr:hypothetical protein [Bacteroidales bacterium]
MKKYIYLLLLSGVLLVSCHKSDEEQLLGRWRLIHETTIRINGNTTEQDYPHDGNTSVLVFENDETYRYTEVKSMKAEADTGVYNFKEKKLYSEKSKTTGEIVFFEKDKLIVDISNTRRKTHSRIFEKMK